MSEPPLSLQGISKNYGSVVAVDDVSLQVSAGSRHAIIGPNGAGKSTLFALVAGTLRPTSGSVTMYGEDVTRLADHQRARRGLARTFQHSTIFASMTVLENVMLAAQRRHGRPAKAIGGQSAASRQAADAALSEVGLLDRPTVPAGSLSHGERRQLEVALALAVDPRILLFDEPTAGMSAAETARFVELVRNLPRQITVLIIEHDLDVVFTLADRVTVLHLGAVVADGAPEQIRDSELVQQIYLGAPPDAELGAGDAGSGVVT
ncbi:ABC transporter ATP-binding protein [Nitriliruptor alkaliphilus]|uniref:ABC transporter ATP-binding protein n=1 Tax=Nitriliruptor alkaliphilus TaxID=427918 RepID=UPI00069907AA|nr:ABC transporter ATP-binding protein [Nitriliruptor alkaliphilus]